MEDHVGNLKQESRQPLPTTDPGPGLAMRLGLVFGIVVVSVLLDQWTKKIAFDQLRFAPAKIYWGDLFRLQYSENPGAFLSLGAELPDVVRYGVFNVGVAILLIAILVYAIRGRELNGLQIAGYALIVGGGVSNWIDRAFREGARVIDFMNMGLGARLRTGIFNVADLAVVFGLALIVLIPRHRTPATPPPTSTPAST